MKKRRRSSLLGLLTYHLHRQYSKPREKCKSHDEDDSHLDVNSELLERAEVGSEHFPEVRWSEVSVSQRSTPSSREKHTEPGICDGLTPSGFLARRDVKSFDFFPPASCKLHEGIQNRCLKLLDERRRQHLHVLVTVNNYAVDDDSSIEVELWDVHGSERTLVNKRLCSLSLSVTPSSLCSNAVSECNHFTVTSLRAKLHAFTLFLDLSPLFIFFLYPFCDLGPRAKRMSVASSEFGIVATITVVDESEETGAVAFSVLVLSLRSFVSISKMELLSSGLLKLSVKPPGRNHFSAIASDRFGTYLFHPSTPGQHLLSVRYSRRSLATISFEPRSTSPSNVPHPLTLGPLSSQKNVAIFTNAPKSLMEPEKKRVGVPSLQNMKAKRVSKRNTFDRPLTVIDADTYQDLRANMMDRPLHRRKLGDVSLTEAPSLDMTNSLDHSYIRSHANQPKSAGNRLKTSATMKHSGICDESSSSHLHQEDFTISQSFLPRKPSNTPASTTCPSSRRSEPPSQMPCSPDVPIFHPPHTTRTEDSHVISDEHHRHQLQFPSAMRDWAIQRNGESQVSSSHEKDSSFHFPSSQRKAHEDPMKIGKPKMLVLERLKEEESPHSSLTSTSSSARSSRNSNSPVDHKTNTHQFGLRGSAEKSPLSSTEVQPRSPILKLMNSLSKKFVTPSTSPLSSTSGSAITPKDVDIPRPLRVEITIEQVSKDIDPPKVDVTCGLRRTNSADVLPESREIISQLHRIQAQRLKKEQALRDGIGIFLQNVIPAIDRYAEEIHAPTNPHTNATVFHLDPKKSFAANPRSMTLDFSHSLRRFSHAPSPPPSVLPSTRSQVKSPGKTRKWKTRRDKLGRLFRLAEDDNRPETSLDNVDLGQSRQSEFLHLRLLVLSRELESLALEVTSLNFDEETSLRRLQELVHGALSLTKRY
jgi:hypothetical protein